MPRFAPRPRSESFEEMFKSFGADLPDITRLVLAMPYALVPVRGDRHSASPSWIVARSRVRRAEYLRT